MKTLYINKMKFLIGFTIILSLCIISIGYNIKAQCLSDNLSSFGQLYSTTGNSLLDMEIFQEASNIYLIFGVNPWIIYFNDGQSPNAYASQNFTQSGHIGTIYFGLQLLQTELMTMDAGPQAVAGIMAHEFSHVLQKVNYCPLQGYRLELHADFMAGYYLGVRGYYLVTNIQAFANSLFRKGDYAFWSQAHHGTPDQRVNCMLEGFNHRFEPLGVAYNYGISYISNY